ncbi:uncharacterized protein [Maniola hyperantus]|uniref:uncharacterized protein n=1 Tax=Aphantopus hyperantus TaxID=2795564 RepID=UPI003748F995
MFKLTSILVLAVLVTDSIGQDIIFPTYRPSSDPVIILPTYIPPPQEPIIRTARDTSAQQPAPLWPSIIDGVRLDPDRGYVRSVAPSSSGSGDRRMKRDIYDPFIPQPSPFPYPRPSGPFNPNPPTRPFPIYAKNQLGTLALPLLETVVFKHRWKSPRSWTILDEYKWLHQNMATIAKEYQLWLLQAKNSQGRFIIIIIIIMINPSPAGSPLNRKNKQYIQYTTVNASKMLKATSLILFVGAILIPLFSCEPIKSKQKRDISLPGLSKPTYRDVIIPNWNPHVKTNPWQSLGGKRRNRRSVETLASQESLLRSPRSVETLASQESLLRSPRSVETLASQESLLRSPRSVETLDSRSQERV